MKINARGVDASCEKTVYILRSVNMDMVMSAGRFPLEGETFGGVGFCVNEDGKGVNQAVKAGYGKRGGRVGKKSRMSYSCYG